MKNIDWNLFKKQKECLVGLVSEGDLGLPEECELIEGVIHLMDAIQDEFEPPKFTREDYQNKLAEIIQGRMMDSPDMCWEAIVEGRTGLDEMSDEGIVGLGRDCWNMEGEIE